MRSGGLWQAGHSNPLAFTKTGMGNDGLFPCTFSLLCEGLLFRVCVCVCVCVCFLEHHAYVP